MIELYTFPTVWMNISRSEGKAICQSFKVKVLNHENAVVSEAEQYPLERDLLICDFHPEK